MALERQPIEVEIFGHTFSLRSEKSEAAVRQIAAYVDERLRQVAAQSWSAGLLRVAIMAAVSIADEYHTATGTVGTLDSLE